MDPQRARIQADLAGVLNGSVRCDDLFLQLYSSDASNYQVTPLAVVRPRNTADVVTTVRYAAENQYSVHPRGAGTSVTGGSLGQGIVMDFSVDMRRISGIEDDQVTVQPGVVLANLNRQLAKRNQIYGPDPATRSVTSMGSVLSTNATGSHWAKYGAPRDNLLSLQVVTADGNILDLPSRDNRSFDSYSDPAARNLEQGVGSIIDRRKDVLESYASQAPINQAGYNLFDIDSPEGKIDLTRLLTGCEGTLGIVTQATLKTTLRPQHRGITLLFFERIETAAQAAIEILNFQPSACDLMDRRLLSMAREIDPAYRRAIPADTEALLLVEFDADSTEDLREKLDAAVNRVHRRKKLAFEARTTMIEEERDFFWRLARRVIPILYRLKGNRRALPFVEDLVINPQKLPDFVNRIHTVLNHHQITASIFAHVPQGHVDVRPFLDLSNADHVRQMKPFARELFELALDCGGTISGSNGDGLSRTWYLRSQFGPLYDVFREVKRVFDPQFVLNPGKVINYPVSELTDHLRSIGVEEGLRESQRLDEQDEESDGKTKEEEPSQPRARKKSKPLPVLEPQLEWNLDEMAMAARSCNGCGRCRTQGAIERMCPIFRLNPTEEASPRAKANLIRNVLSGNIELDQLSSEEVKSVSDLCVNCHQCRIECPAGVDIPKLVCETKAQYVAANGLKFSQWIFGRLDFVYSLGSKMPSLTNWAMKNRLFRWGLDRFLGIAQGRKLPRFSNRTFLKWAARRQPVKTVRGDRRKVVYFVDAYANWNDSEIGRAVVSVLEHNGVEVFVPPRQKLSGMSLISDGLVGRARVIAKQNVELLADAVRQGYQVITSEPSANLALKHEYLNLLDEVDARLVAENCQDIHAYLWGLHQQGLLELDFRPVNTTVAYHMPCHTKAIHRDRPVVEILQLIPGMTMQTIDKGCSGMAGTYGMKRENYRKSLRAGFGLINALRAPEIVVGVTECSTCKMQMEHGTTKPTVHPIKLLALAYGLMPELADLLSRRSNEKTLS